MKRDFQTLPLAFPAELIIDNFAGGGGTSTGLEAAFGRPIDIAINHDPEALAMHAINHPHTLHLCESVWEVDPIKVTNNQPVALVWLSPDCKHFSKAKGGTPVSKEIRGLAWVGMRWAALTKPRVIMLENVEEFQTWGPIIVDADGNAKPDLKRKGKTFQSFVRQLRALGYNVDWREMRACDNGAPTIRKRLFLIARRDGLPISWPEKTHGEPTSADVIAGNLLPYRTAAECIDFSTESRSIFERDKALAVNTQRRVAKGLWRHVLTNENPFIVPAIQPEHAGQMLTPFVTEHANASTQRTMPADVPQRTQCAQVKGGHFSIVAPALAPLRGTSESHLVGHAIDAPLSGITASGTHHALIGAHLVTIGYGERKGQTARTRDLKSPLGTIVATNKNGMAAACFEQANGGFYEGDGRPADVPLSTITASGSNQRLITAYCVKYYSSGGQWQALGDPMSTIPTKARVGLVQVVHVPADCLADEHRRRARMCADLLREHLPEHFGDAAEMVLFAYDGQLWVLVDITLRMLKAPELFRAQGFPRSYIIDRIPNPALLFKDGRQIANPLSLPTIPLPTTSQIRMCGNSVSPVQAKALALSNFAHEALIARAA